MSELPDVTQSSSPNSWPPTEEDDEPNMQGRYVGTRMSLRPIEDDEKVRRDSTSSHQSGPSTSFSIPKKESAAKARKDSISTRRWKSSASPSTPKENDAKAGRGSTSTRQSESSASPSTPDAKTKESFTSSLQSGPLIPSILAVEKRVPLKQPIRRTLYDPSNRDTVKTEMKNRLLNLVRPKDSSKLISEDAKGETDKGDSERPSTSTTSRASVRITSTVSKPSVASALSDISPSSSTTESHGSDSSTTDEEYDEAKREFRRKKTEEEPIYDPSKRVPIDERILEEICVKARCPRKKLKNLLTFSLLKGRQKHIRK